MSDPSPEVPDFTTARLLLRRLVPEDAAGLHLAYGDAEAMRFWDAPLCGDVAETERRILRSTAVDPAWHAAWAVLERSSQAFVGMVNYHDRAPWHRRLGLGWVLVPQCWRQGFMTEAMRVVLPHCFGALDAHRVEAEIEPANERSARLAERLGFRRDGLLRERICVRGEPRSVWMYSLLRPDWAGATAPPGV
jgi:RimJ/RimL family protein N-acetyltransferase